MALAIQAHELTKTIGWWRPQVIVNKLNLEVEEGRIFGILGPNGAGKTSAFKLLLGLSRITSGTAQLFGVSVPMPQSRNKVGYLPEVVNHPDYLTIFEYLSYHAELAALPDIPDSVASHLKRVGMADTERLPLGTLSKGMRQRVDLARVLMLKSRLILLDEPVTGLDPLGQATLKEILLSLRRDGITILLNSHAIGILSELCDEIGILAQGRMIRSGKLDDLLATNRHAITVRGAFADPLAAIPERDPDDRAIPLSENRWLLRLTDRRILSRDIETLLKSGAEILEAGPVRLTLEELFTQTLKAEGIAAESVEACREVKT